MKIFNVIIILFCFLFTISCAKSHSQNDAIETENTVQIIGGNVVTYGDPIMASTVGLVDLDSNAICSGTLIGNDLVLTAGHCIGKDPSQMLIYFGNNMLEATTADFRKVVDALVYPEFDPNRPDNMGDMGLIRFHPGQGIPNWAKPAKIYPDFKKLESTTSLIVAGFGVNKSWLWETGEGLLRRANLKISDPHYTQTEILLDQNVRRGACVGDSGGPAYIETNGQIYFVGVISRGDDVRLPLVPSCFLFSLITRADVYTNWIESSEKKLKKP